MVEALCEEAVLQKEYLAGEEINTVYFGGGTPSLLEISDLKLIISELIKNYKVANDAEITLEANPDDINKQRLQQWKAIGINRLSIGIQSFVEDELRWMNRAHSAQQANDSLQWALQEFDNITIDLIYGSPLLTDSMWQENIARALCFNIPHLSCYALTVEEKTPLHKHISKAQSKDVNNDQQARQFLLLMQWLRDAGYEHYEVSNFAKPGFRSRHNFSYWKGAKYLGLGPSAHSYNGTERKWNIAHNQQYIQSIRNKNIPSEVEILTAANRLNEYIMISLRTKEGIDLDEVEKNWGAVEKQRLEQNLVNGITNNLILKSGSNVRLTDEGMLRADGIAAGLFSSFPLTQDKG